jgi:tetratricopeptide (TPR) repeat protein
MRSSRFAMPRRIVTSASLSVLSCLLLLLTFTVALPAQELEQLAVGPPQIHRVEPPSATATAKELERIGDALQADKDYLDGVDYYQAALAKDPHNAVLINKIGISELEMHRYREAKKSFDQAVRIDKNYANAYANLGVVYYQETSYSKSIRYYDKAISLDNEEAVFYNNRAASFFAKKEFEKASVDYAKALDLDPDIFERTGRGGGVQARLPSPEDRAHYDYVLAKLYARNGMADRSLHYLRKALEDGYKNIKNVYTDNEFSELRKDPRFTELMASKPVALKD